MILDNPQNTNDHLPDDGKLQHFNWDGSSLGIIYHDQVIWRGKLQREKPELHNPESPEKPELHSPEKFESPEKPEDPGMQNSKKRSYYPFEYWYIKLNSGQHQICLVKKCMKNEAKTCCIIDEIKKVFGLSKLGTHTACYRKKRSTICQVTKDNYLLIRTKLFMSDDEVKILRDVGLHKLKMKISDESQLMFFDKVQEIILFYNLLGFDKICESKVLLRWLGDSYVEYLLAITSFPNLEKESKMASRETYTKWFPKVNSKECRLFDMIYKRYQNGRYSIFTLNIMNYILGDARSEIDNIIRRIDKKYIHESNNMINRMRGLLQNLIGNPTISIIENTQTIS